MNALLKEVIEMERQLRESQEHGEQREFIEDFQHDLARLLNKVGQALYKQSAEEAA